MGTEGASSRGVAGALKGVVLGTLVLLGVAEVGFRLVGLAMDRSDDSPEGAEITILAEGDSFTYGIGGLSFPHQLEEMLNERAGERKYRAVNKGVPGLNSAVVADNLAEHLDTYKPDVVIITIGENNSWNAIRVQADPSLLTRVDQTLMHSRVYKFIRVAAIGWNNNTFHEAAYPGGDPSAEPLHHVGDPSENIGLPFPSGEHAPEPHGLPDVPPEGQKQFLAIVDKMEAGAYDDVIVMSTAFVEAYPDDPAGYIGLGSALMRKDRNEEAAAVLARGTSAKITDASMELWFELGQAYRRAEQPNEARRAFLEGLEKWPLSRPIYWGLSEVHHDLGDTFATLNDVAGISGVQRNDLHVYLTALASEHTGSDVDRQVSEAFEADVARMIELARARGVKLIFSSYPDVVYPEVERVTAREGVAYIDFRPHFEARFESRDDYISPDRCHCNTAGYGLMAEVFADAVVRVLDGEEAAR